MKFRRVAFAIGASLAFMASAGLIYLLVVRYLSRPLGQFYRTLLQLVGIAPQDWIWAAVIGLAVLIGLRNFSSRRKLESSIVPNTQSRPESLESWLLVLQERKKGTYFGWRLANRLAELESQIADHPERLPSPQVREYLDMGHDRRTIDATGARSSSHSEIDAAIEYLERRIEADRGG